MNTSDCPRPEHLVRYVAGKGTAAEQERLSRHLRTCDSCSRAVSELSSSPNTGQQPLPERALLSDGSGKSTERSAATQFQHRIPDQVSPGQRLGQYELLSVIGRGGMGVVLKARHVRLDRIVALKVLSSAVVQNEEMLKRFDREMQAVARLDHKHIVRAFDADEIDGVHFMVMEFVDGIDLSALTRRRGPLPVPDACELVRQAATGLQHVFENGMVHRDLKPGNLMLTVAGQVKILDLGLALLHATAVDGKELTATGQLLGTIDYMSPEQADNTHAVDIRTDIYSLGATLFALMVGHGPFGGRKYKSQFRKIAALATQPAPSLLEFRNDVSPDLAAVVANLLEHEADERTQTPAEIVAAATPFCHGADPRVLIADAMSRSGISADDWAPISISFSMEESSSLLAPSQQTTRSVRPAALPTVSLQDVSATDPHPQVAGRQAATAVIDPPFATVNSPRRSFRSRIARPAAVAVIAVLVAMAAWNSVKDHFRPHITGSSDSGVADGTQPPNVHVPRATQPAADETVVAAITDDAVRRIRDSSPDAADLQDVCHLLQASADPTVRTAIIHQVAAAGVDPQRLVDQLNRPQTPSVRAALVMALGEYDTDTLPAELRGTLTPALLEWFQSENDPALHSAVEWLLRRWGAADEVQSLLPILRRKSIPRDSGWYVTSQGQTMVVIPGPVTFTMGSPDDEADRVTNKPLQDETLHQETIPYSFAISTKEVSRQQFFDLRPEHWKSEPANQPDLPHNNCQWDAAAWHCNRLSELDGIPSEQWCYISIHNSNGRMEARSNALELTGYRLPTDIEWEMACRAGTLTAQPFGHDRSMLRHYAFGAIEAHGIVQIPGLRKPNDLGLFDMLGNISEWIHDTVTKPSGERARRLRGGSVWTPANGLRSAARYHYDVGFTNERAGFRVARTIVSPP
ncbi:MAG: bifunctional serine/threonine-protein kinase/formylglycine-generating enzyme family protein [Planctomycetaceae bacterium]